MRVKLDIPQYVSLPVALLMLVVALVFWFRERRRRPKGSQAARTNPGERRGIAETLLGCAFVPTVLILTICFATAIVSLLGKNHWILKNQIAWVGFGIVALPVAFFTTGLIVQAILVTGQFFRFRRVKSALQSLQAGDTDGAILELQRQREVNDRDANVWHTLGAAYSIQQKWAEALEAFDMAVTLKPADPEIAASRFTAVWQLGRTEEALSLCDAVCRQHPTRFDLVCRYCLLLANSGRIEEACTQLKRAEHLKAVNVMPLPGKKALHEAQNFYLQQCRDSIAKAKVTAAANGESTATTM